VAFFTETNFYSLCDELAITDHHLLSVIKSYGYPPYWCRPNTFETLVHIILEQQVSLASALAALNKLKERLPQLTPASILLLTDREFRACYVSRQKTGYIKHLAECLLSGQLLLTSMETMSDDEVRQQLTFVKGIGNWTVDIYLIFVLHRTDVFPVGDLAVVNAVKKLKCLPPATTREDILLVANQWRPYRTIATMLLWHFYLEQRKKGGSAL
jgi:DNA-3-methyladenine glycosylase II